MDPITFALIVGAALWVTDVGSGGLVRAEVGGGASGAVRGVARSWWGRRVRTHQRRQKARAKSKAGRLVNYLQDEGKAYVAGVREGWPEGRARAHDKRRERWAKKPPWWKRAFGASEPPNDEPEQPEGDEPQPEGSGSSQPEGSGSSPWGDPEPIGSNDQAKPERFRLDVHLQGAPKPSSSGGFASRLPKDEAIERAREWARDSIMSQLSTADRGVLYRTTGGTDEKVGAFAGWNDPAGDQPTENSTQRGPHTVADLTTAPAVIAAWEELHDRFEQIEADVDDLETTAAQLRDGAGDFATGTEGDAAGAVQEALEKLQAAREAVQATIDALHEEWDAHIAAAEGGQAAAHAPFQEV